MMTYEQIIDKIDQLEEANLLLAALELRIFTALGRKLHTARAIAKKAGSREEGTAALLDALVAMQAIKKQGSRYGNTSETFKHLCASSKDYKKGTVMLRQETRREWEQLLSVIRNGRDLSPYAGNDDTEFRYLFSHAMHERSGRFSEKVARFITRSAAGDMLDLGSGPGSYSAAILRQDKKARVTLLDRPAALKVAREIFRSMRLAKRTCFLEGDLFDTPYGENRDTVFYSNILHIYNEKENARIFRKAHRALKPGGRFILADLFLKENRTEPYNAAIFSVTMLLFTATGKTYTFDETERLLSAAGFYKFKRHDIGMGSSLMEAVKR